MTPRAARRVFRVHPRTYRLAWRGPRTSAMCFGFECGDGWADILARLTFVWRVMWCVARIDVIATQVKEKFGTLRYYHVVDAPRAWPRFLRRWAAIVADGFVRDAEYESTYTCEMCGEPGRELHCGGWWVTLCDVCVERRVIPT